MIYGREVWKMSSILEYLEENAIEKENMIELENLILELIKEYWLDTQSKARHTNVTI
jgi:hypothetical protein